MCIVSMYVENKKKNLIKWGKQSPFMHLELGSKIYVNQVVMTKNMTNRAAFCLRCEVISSLKLWGGFSINLVIL